VLERNSRGHVDGSYLNQWAAHIPGGRDVAQRVASELGYVNHGQVSNAELPVVLQSGVFRTWGGGANRSFYVPDICSRDATNQM